MEAENQGRVTAWQIREFPEGLRRQVTEQARIEDLTVGDFLARCMVMLRDSGWPREIAVDGFANAVNHRVDLTRLRQAAEIVAILAPHKELLPKGIASPLWATLRQEARALRASQVARLPAPAKFDGLQTAIDAPRADEFDGLQT
jgi:hypothetical protein